MTGIAGTIEAPPLRFKGRDKDDTGLVMVGQWRRCLDLYYHNPRWVFVEYGLYADRSKAFVLYEPLELNHA